MTLWYRLGWVRFSCTIEEEPEIVVRIEGEVLVGDSRRIVEWSRRELWTGNLSVFIQQRGRDV